MKKKKSKKKSLFKKFKGFTLVELLAVIVILAIIMIIAIPAVLNTMESARRKTMLEFAQKVFLTGQRKFIEDKSFNNLASFSKGTYIYSIKQDLGLNNVGDFDGYYIIWQEGDYTAHHIAIWNKDYVLVKLDVDKGEITESDMMTRGEFIKASKEQGISNAEEIVNQADSTNKMFSLQLLALNMSLNCETDDGKKVSAVFGDDPKNVVNVCEYLKG